MEKNQARIMTGRFVVELILELINAINDNQSSCGEPSHDAADRGHIDSDQSSPDHFRAYWVTIGEDNSYSSQRHPQQEDTIVIQGLHVEENMTANPARVDHHANRARRKSASELVCINRGQAKLMGEEIGLSPDHPLVEFTLKNENPSDCYHAERRTRRKQFEIISIMVDT